MKYSKKQIKEAINHWQKVLESWPNHLNADGDQYEDPYAQLTWGEIKKQISQKVKDNETVDIALVCGNVNIADATLVCYVDVDNDVDQGDKRLIFSMAGYGK